MKLFWAFPISIFLFLGCATTGGADASPDVAEASSSKADDGKRADIERKLKIAKERLMVAELELKAFDLQHKNDVRYAKADVGIAEAKLAKFREVDAPNRLASEKLGLQTALDRAQEAEDELAQIQIMYEDQDLDDLTAEFVVKRGQRAAERARARIEIAEGQFKSLEERELPQEEKGLELALDKSQAALNKAGVDGEIGRQKKSIALQEARDTIDKLQQELKELEEEAKP